MTSNGDGSDQRALRALHRRKRLRILHFVALILFGVIMFWPGEKQMPPIDRDEPRYAQATEQMLATGNFIDVRFQDQPRYLQPAGIYWLQAIAEKIAGTPGQRQIWVHRLPSMIAAICAVLLTGAMAARLFGRGAGMLAAILLASCVLLNFEARLATIDATLLVTILLAQTALSITYLTRDVPTPPRRRIAALFWGALGCGLMLKGPVILLVVGGTLAALAIVERRIGWMKRLQPRWGVLLMLAIALPWLIAIGVLSHGDFFSRSVGTNFLGKVATGQQAHGLPPGYHLLLFSLMFWPSSLLAVLALPFVWTNRRMPEVKFLLCWIIPTWLVFELIATKLPHYVLPIYPAIACLTAAAALTPKAWIMRRWARWLFAAYAAVWMALGAALAIGPSILLWRFEGVFSFAGFIIGLSAIAILAAALEAAWRSRPAVTATFAAMAAFLIFAGSYALVLPRIEAIWLSPRIAAAVAKLRPCPDSVLASSAFSEPSLVFLAGTDTKLVDPVSAANLLISDPHCGLALIGATQSAEFLARMAEAGQTPRRLTSIQGINYSNGRRLDLTLYAGGEAPAPDSPPQ